MKWDEWLKKIIKEITSDYTISEETSKSFFEELMQLLKYFNNCISSSKKLFEVSSEIV